MKRRYFIPCGCALLGVCLIIACMDDSLSPPTTNNKPTAVEYLRRQFEEKHVSLPDCRLRDGKLSRSVTDIDYDATDFTIDWKHYQVFNSKDNRIWMFPITPSHPMSGHVYARSGATVKRRATPVTFKLMVRKLGKRGVSRLITYIPEPKYLRNRDNLKVEDLGWDLRGTNYSGLVLNSHLNGELVFGLKYESGRAVYRFVLRRDRAGEVRSHGYTASGAHLSFGFHSRKDTRVSSYSDGESEINYCAGCGRSEDMCICYELTCSFCGQPIDDCTCWTVDPDPEPEPEPDWGIYCPTCGFAICQCCPRCHSYPCDCEPEGGDGTDTDEGEYEDTDQGGGSSGTADSPSVKKAKKIFRNSSLIQANWEIIGCALDKITSTSIGQKLYDAAVLLLNGKTLAITYKEDGGAKFEPETGFVRWDMQHSSELFHELFHFYQNYGETSETREASKMNRELEAHLAQHYYITQISDEEFKWWVKLSEGDSRWNATRELAEIVDEFSNLRPGYTNADLKARIETRKNAIVGEFRKIGYDNISYPWDTKREGIVNFKYLNKLNK